MAECRARAHVGFFFHFGIVIYMGLYFDLMSSSVFEQEIWNILYIDDATMVYLFERCCLCLFSTPACTSTNLISFSCLNNKFVFTNCVEYCDCELRYDLFPEYSSLRVFICASCLLACESFEIRKACGFFFTSRRGLRVIERKASLQGYRENVLIVKFEM